MPKHRIDYMHTVLNTCIAGTADGFQSTWEGIASAKLVPGRLRGIGDHRADQTITPPAHFGDSAAGLEKAAPAFPGCQRVRFPGEHCRTIGQRIEQLADSGGGTKG